MNIKEFGYGMGYETPLRKRNLSSIATVENVSYALRRWLGQK